MNAAQTKLQTLLEEIRDKKSPSLSYWRLWDENSKKDAEHIRHLLETFATEDFQEQPENILQETTDLFYVLNQHMAAQEDASETFQRFQAQKRLGPARQEGTDTETLLTTSTTQAPPHMAVVIGGKYSPSPNSISECLVAKLAETCPKIITVSRSTIPPESLPPSILHLAKRHLDSDDPDRTGEKEFKDVIQTAVEEWKQLPLKDDDGKPLDLIFYFTLGQHKGENKPFWRNIQGAWNFGMALERFQDHTNKDSIKVVVTGTDATLPSDTADAVVEADDNTTWEIPTYKIMEYNYTYAVSKICQFYVIGLWVADIVGMDEEQRKEWNATINKMEQHVLRAGDDGNYHPPEYDNNEDAINMIAMEDLNNMSRQVSSVLLSSKELEGCFSIAQGISICYTPLHASAWTEQAIKAAADIEDKTEGYYAQKAYVLEQIVKRMKNALSIQQAVLSHFCSHDSNRKKTLDLKK